MLTIDSFVRKAKYQTCDFDYEKLQRDIVKGRLDFHIYSLEVKGKGSMFVFRLPIFQNAIMSTKLFFRYDLIQKLHLSDLNKHPYKNHVYGEVTLKTSISISILIDSPDVIKEKNTHENQWHLLPLLKQK